MSSTGNWVTINGAHVLIGATGKVEKGPKNLIGKTYDTALSTASGNRVPDPFTDTRTSNTVNVGNYSSLSSARADAKNVKKQAKEIEKERKEKERISQENKLYRSKREFDRELRKAEREGDVDKINSIHKELKEKGFVVGPNGGVISANRETVANIGKKIRNYQYDFNRATSPEAKQAIVTKAKNEGIYLGSNGYFSTRKPAPASINITMRGVKIDLSTASGRKDAQMLSAGLSKESKIKFQEFCISKGLDPVTLKPIQ